MRARRSKNFRSLINLILWIFVLLLSACSEGKESGKQRSTDHEFPRTRDGRHFLAEQPLKLLSKERSDLLKLQERIEQAEQRARNYKYIYATPGAQIPLRALDIPNTPLRFEEATSGLTGNGALKAFIKTSLGEIVCTLDETEPKEAVTHFVALARGKNPWQNRRVTAPSSAPYYQDTLIYKVIKNTALFGGYPKEAGETYLARRTAPNPASKSARETSSPHTLAVLSGQQGGEFDRDFVITTAAKTAIDRPFHPIGSCESHDIIQKIVNQDTTSNGLPLEEIKLKSVRIRRD